MEKRGEKAKHIYHPVNVLSSPVTMKNVKYAHIFGNSDQQLIVTREFCLPLKEREAILQQNGDVRLPVGSLDPDVTVLQ